MKVIKSRLTTVLLWQLKESTRWWSNAVSAWSLGFKDVWIVVGAFNSRLILDLELVDIVSAKQISSTLSPLLTTGNCDQKELLPIPQSIFLENITVTLHWQRNVSHAVLHTRDPNEKCQTYVSLAGSIQRFGLPPDQQNSQFVCAL